ncbi:uncharacterized protein LOC113318044 [Papaver somniferum]|uniref:uncharacterized protein LOC113318044 n=1 Tax=Papaver somniferum TaxID=3469 RepID=UPI000E6FAF36|nr:uncharacterized protein LOC113318044 [Papaver somniferum]
MEQREIREIQQSEMMGNMMQAMLKMQEESLLSRRPNGPAKELETNPRNTEHETFEDYCSRFPDLDNDDNVIDDFGGESLDDICEADIGVEDYVVGNSEAEIISPDSTDVSLANVLNDIKCKKNSQRRDNENLSKDVRKKMPGPLVKSPFTTCGLTTPKIPAVGILKKRFDIATDVVAADESNLGKVRSIEELSSIVLADVDAENGKRKAVYVDNGCSTSTNGATDVQGLGVRGAKNAKPW